MWHEWLAVVLANVAVGVDAGLASEVAGELTTIIVLNDDNSVGLRKDAADFLLDQRLDSADAVTH